MFPFYFKKGEKIPTMSCVNVYIINDTINVIGFIWNFTNVKPTN